MHPPPQRIREVDKRIPKSQYFSCLVISVIFFNIEIKLDNSVRHVCVIGMPSVVFVSLRGVSKFRKVLQR